MELFSKDDTRLFPLFWIKGEDEQTLRAGVRDVKSSGCGALVVESRTHPDYLGKGWWRDLKIIAEECASLKMKMWVLDDMHFPSGYAAGAASGTGNCRRMITERHMDVIGPIKGAAFVVCDDETPKRPGAEVVAVVACRRLEQTNLKRELVDMGGFYLGESVDLTGTVKDGMAYFDVPNGIWRVFVITSACVEERQPPRGFVNPLSFKASNLMIKKIYEPHLKQLKKYAGTTFMGFFSDEPGLRAGRGYHAVIGEYPRIPLPWSEDMLNCLSQLIGADATPLLPSLWYETEHSAQMRYAFMNEVSRLYGQNYSGQLGSWCAEHGLEYIGHVIEQNNAHTRLGSGAGHFFRAIGGQQMAGIDIVLHELRPEFFGIPHAWKSQDFEADDDFFRYMLCQMAVSAAHIDPNKKGRTMCEIFGAYGWQEDAGEMRYLASFIMSRGVNYFSPHAFTLDAFPDPDSPGHFDKVHQPLMPFIKDLFGYMARIGALIDGGRHMALAHVLYNAEGEWMNGTKDSVLTQSLVKALNQAGIECEIVPFDALNAVKPKLLFVPGAKLLPKELAAALTKLKNEGSEVYYVDIMPENIQGRLISTDEMAALVPKGEYSAAGQSRYVHIYPYKKQNEYVFLLFNEDVTAAHEYEFWISKGKHAYELDCDSQTVYGCTYSSGKIHTCLNPGELKAFIVTNELIPAQTRQSAIKDKQTNAVWSISIKAPGEEFKTYKTAKKLFNITAPKCLPRFTGIIAYEADISFPKGCMGLALNGTSGAAEVFIDGASIVRRVMPPYEFVFSTPLEGRRNVRIEITNTPVFCHRDELSFYAPIKPSGMTEQPSFMKGCDDTEL